MLFLSCFALFRNTFGEPVSENTESLLDSFIGFVQMTLIANDALNAGGVEKVMIYKGYIIHFRICTKLA